MPSKKPHPQSHDLGAESAVLALLLNRAEEHLDLFREKLKPGDFYSSHHALIYRTILETADEGRPVGLATVFERLERHAGKELEERELNQYRNLFGTWETREETAQQLLERVRRRARNRELASLLKDLAEESGRLPDHVDRHLDRALNALASLARDGDADRPSAFSALLSQAQDSHRPIRSGWPSLDSSPMAVRPGELVLVTGRTGHGKTHLLLNLLARWMEEGGEGRFLYYSYEMPPQAMAGRLKTMVEVLRGGRAPLAAKLKPWEDWDRRLTIHFKPTWDVEKVAADALSAAAAGKAVQAVFVDPITAVAAPPGKERDRRRDLELSFVSRRLKDLAHRLGCPVLATAPTRLLRPEDDGGKLRDLLSQGTDFSNVEVEDAIRKRRPRLEHLAERGLEQEADLVIGLLNLLADYQEELDPESRQVFRKRHTGALELAALKNRFGALESVEMIMDFQSGLMTDPLGKTRLEEEP